MEPSWLEMIFSQWHLEKLMYTASTSKRSGWRNHLCVARLLGTAEIGWCIFKIKIEKEFSVEICRQETISSLMFLHRDFHLEQGIMKKMKWIASIMSSAYIVLLLCFPWAPSWWVTGSVCKIESEKSNMQFAVCQYWSSLCAKPRSSMFILLLFSCCNCTNTTRHFLQRGSQ